jgi:hypothetical protein
MGSQRDTPSEPLPRMTKPSADEAHNLVQNSETLNELPELGAAQCSIPEAAAAMGISAAELEDLLADHPEARTAFDKAAARARIDLRAAQFAQARTNAPMAAFVAKQYLGHAERRELDQSEEPEVAGAADRVRRKLDALIAHREAEDDPSLGRDL